MAEKVSIRTCISNGAKSSWKRERSALPVIPSERQEKILFERWSGYLTREIGRDYGSTTSYNVARDVALLHLSWFRWARCDESGLINEDSNED